MPYRTLTSAKVDASSNNIPTAYSTAAGSRILTGLAASSSEPLRNITIHNETAGRIRFTTAGTNDAVPSDTSAASGYVIDDSTVTFNNIHISDVVYIQSDTGSAITSGLVEVMVW